MKLKDIPYNGWYFGLSNSNAQDKTLEAIESSKTITEAKKKIIIEMIKIITECTTVIHLANTMETPKECTCAGNCGDET